MNKLYLSKHKTERLLIRPLTDHDVSAWKSFFYNNPGLKFLNFIPDGNAQQRAEAWIHRQLKRYQDQTYGMLGLFLPGDILVGQCGLLVQTIDNKTVIEVGYHVLPEFQRQGFATEAARFFKEFAFRSNITRQLVSLIHPENIPSQKVAVKNGMSPGKQSVFHEFPVIIFSVSSPDIKS